MLFVGSNIRGEKKRTRSMIDDAIAQINIFNVIISMLSFPISERNIHIGLAPLLGGFELD